MNQSTGAVLSFDFSADRLDVALRTPDGRSAFSHRAYDNNLPGFLALKQDVLASLVTEEGAASLVAVGESTGLYWWHAFYHLATDPDFAPYQPQLALLNPMHVKHFRKALPERDKDDAADAQLIDLFFQAHGVKQFYAFDERYLPLRQITRAYSRLVHALAAEKAFCLTFVYLLASEYKRLRPFSDVFGVTSQQVLTEYPDVAAIAAIPLDELAAALDEVARGRLKDAAATAQTLHQVAADSFPLSPALRDTVHGCLTLTLDNICFMESQQRAYQQLIADQLAQLPEADLLLAETGMGPILVAGLLGEIGDTRRFISGQKYDRKQKRWRDKTYQDGQAGVARMAGLWWPKNSSGRFEGQERHLAHERNPFLRHWLVQTAYCLKGHQAEYADYYWKKYREVPKHQHKRALILTARKAVRLVFALLHKGQMARLEEQPTA
jgi:transposase